MEVKLETTVLQAERKIPSAPFWPLSEWVAQSCPNPCDPMDYTVHGILLARILEWVAVPSSRGSSQPRYQTQVSHISGGFFTSWATWEALLGLNSHSSLYSSDPISLLPPLITDTQLLIDTYRWQQPSHWQRKLDFCLSHTFLGALGRCGSGGGWTLTQTVHIPFQSKEVALSWYVLKCLLLYKYHILTHMYGI